MFEFKTIQLLNKPIDEVFNFFEKPENLEKITPNDIGFIIKTPRPLVMKKGAIFEYTIKLGYIKFPWRTLITLYDPPKLFQDVQTIGPYKKWVHTHEFIELGEKTKIIDTIEYDLFPFLLRRIMNKIYIKNKIEQIFSYRKKALNQIFN